MSEPETRLYTPQGLAPAEADAIHEEELSVKDAIIRELVRTLKHLGAKGDLLGVACSYGETYTDAEVLAELREWNGHGGKPAPAGEPEKDPARETRERYYRKDDTLKGKVVLTGHPGTLSEGAPLTAPMKVVDGTQYQWEYMPGTGTYRPVVGHQANARAVLDHLTADAAGVPAVVAEADDCDPPLVVEGGS